MLLEVFLMVIFFFEVTPLEPVITLEDSMAIDLPFSCSDTLWESFTDKILLGCFSDYFNDCSILPSLSDDLFSAAEDSFLDSLRDFSTALDYFDSFTD